MRREEDDRSTVKLRGSPEADSAAPFRCSIQPRSTNVSPLLTLNLFEEVWNVLVERVGEYVVL